MRDEATVSEELWKRLAPLIPVRERRFRYPSRLPGDDRAALEGILWVLRNDVPWRELPTTLFGVSGVTCWRRLRDWAEAGVWQQLHELLLAECNAAGLLDLHRALVDSSRIHALTGLRDGSEPGQPGPDKWSHPAAATQCGAARGRHCSRGAVLAELCGRDALARHRPWTGHMASLRAALTRLTAVDFGFLDLSSPVIALADEVDVDVVHVTNWMNDTIYGGSAPASIAPPPPETGFELLPGWEKDWLVDTREHLRLMQMQSLETAAERLVAAGRPAKALPYALSAVRAQPWSESANRLLIEIHARRGDRSNVLRQFLRFQQALDLELDVAPGPDVLTLVRQLYPYGIDLLASGDDVPVQGRARGVDRRTRPVGRR